MASFHLKKILQFLAKFKMGTIKEKAWWGGKAGDKNPSLEENKSRFQNYQEMGSSSHLGLALPEKKDLAKI